MTYQILVGQGRLMISYNFMGGMEVRGGGCRFDPLYPVIVVWVVRRDPHKAKLRIHTNNLIDIIGFVLGIVLPHSDHTR